MIERDLVTGEAVVLELRLAKLPSRGLGFIIDAAIQILLLLGLVALLSAVSGVADAALSTALWVAGIALIFVGMPAAIEALTHGRSLGKRAMGLRVVRDDGGTIRFRHALVRALAAFFIDLWVLGWLGIGLITSLASSRGKRVGDYLAGTVVVRERIPVRVGPTAQMPPQLARWAAGLELSSLPNDLALAVRQYLSRMAELAPDVREAMGRRLAMEVSQHIRQNPPSGLPPEAFLSAVLVERRNRELARLSADDQRRSVAQPQPTEQPPADDQPRSSTVQTSGPFTPPG